MPKSLSDQDHTPAKQTLLYFLLEFTFCAKPEHGGLFHVTPTLSSTPCRSDHIISRVCPGFKVLLLWVLCPTFIDLKKKSLLSCLQEGKTELFHKLLQGLTFKGKDFIMLVVITFIWQTSFYYVFIKQQIHNEQRWVTSFPGSCGHGRVDHMRRWKCLAKRNQCCLKVRSLRQPVELYKHGTHQISL